MKASDLFVVGSASVAGGIPEDVSRALVQLVVAVLAWLSTKALDYISNRTKKGTEK